VIRPGRPAHVSKLFRMIDTRHSHSTLLHALGVDLKVQQELLRHADVRTTMNIYTQAVPTALREAISQVVRLA
jgi:integrase